MITSESNYGVDDVILESRVGNTSDRVAGLNSDIRELIAIHAPVYRLDNAEPFRPELIAWSILDRPEDSESFQSLDAPIPSGARVLEAAVWWDWDIQHGFELEHFWLVLDSEDMRRRCRSVFASAHGGFREIGIAASGEVEIYCEPGKHGHAESPSTFVFPEATYRALCGRLAGRAGGIEPAPFRGRLHYSARDHRIFTNWLRSKAFSPSFCFDTKVETGVVPATTWETMRGWIPDRVHQLADRCGNDFDVPIQFSARRIGGEPLTSSFSNVDFIIREVNQVDTASLQLMIEQSRKFGVGQVVRIVAENLVGLHSLCEAVVESGGTQWIVLSIDDFPHERLPEEFCEVQLAWRVPSTRDPREARNVRYLDLIDRGRPRAEYHEYLEHWLVIGDRRDGPLDMMVSSH